MSEKSESLAMKYLDTLDLSGKSPAEIAEIFLKADKEIQTYIAANSAKRWEF